jgi:hypothetical protein
VAVLGRAAKTKLVHLKSRRVTGAIVLTWDVRRAQALRWRVLRCESGFAAGPFDDTVVGNGQTLVSDQVRPGSRDDLDALDAPPAGAFFYTIFCEDERGAWHRQARLKLDSSDPALGRRAQGDFEAGGARLGWRDQGEVHRAGSGDSPGHG